MDGWSCSPYNMAAPSPYNMAAPSQPAPSTSVQHGGLEESTSGAKQRPYFNPAASASASSSGSGGARYGGGACAASLPPPPPSAAIRGVAAPGEVLGVGDGVWGSEAVPGGRCRCLGVGGAALAGPSGGEASPQPQPSSRRFEAELSNLICSSLIRV